MKKWKEFCEDSKQNELSDDINDKDLELSSENSKEDWEIQEILDIFRDPEDIPQEVKESAVIGANTDLTNKEVKRGDIIWMTALLKRKGASMNSPSVTGVLELRVKDIFYGLQKLNSILKRD